MKNSKQPQMKIAIIVAIAQDGAIGAGGDLIWRLPADMKYFKELTMGHHVLMGRKTYESIPDKFKPLPGRINLIVSRQKDYHPEGVEVFSELQDAVDYARSHGEQTLMVIGGGEIYRQTVPMADMVFLTRVYQDFPAADTHFHFPPKTGWREISRTHRAKDDKNAFDVDFLVFEKNTIA